MGLQHTPLEVTNLSAEAQRALGPGPAKMMAARGLAPLARAGDLISVLYQLSVDSDQKVASAAAKTAAELPANILEAGLASTDVDARVLDFFAGKVGLKNEQLGAVLVANSALADETVVDMAGKGSAALVDLIAQNEQRLLRCPAVIGAMYKNAKARMSTVDRAVELAVRNSVKVDAIPAWDELVASVMQSGKEQQPEVPNQDALFASAAAMLEDKGGEIVEVDDAEPEEAVKEIPIGQMSIPMKIRLATLGNAFARSQLIRDPIRLVAMATIKSPAIKDSEAIKYSANNTLSEDVITYIANKKDWTKLYVIKANLVRNAKCPLPQSMRLLPHLREKDLRMIAKSKNIPSALSAQAKKLVMNRGKKK